MSISDAGTPQNSHYANKVVGEDKGESSLPKTKQTTTTGFEPLEETRVSIAAREKACSGMHSRVSVPKLHLLADIEHVAT